VGRRGIHTGSRTEGTAREATRGAERRASV
jgi:hypothetical protein